MTCQRYLRGYSFVELVRHFRTSNDEIIQLFIGKFYDFQDQQDNWEMENSSQVDELGYEKERLELEIVGLKKNITNLEDEIEKLKEETANV
ncbi:MAG: hypothetical protein HRU28_03425 [Rhizobiales bacterium]|nr:hypothetical protein [Hyphomicrobiales bacterium]